MLNLLRSRGPRRSNLLYFPVADEMSRVLFPPPIDATIRHVITVTWFFPSIFDISHVLLFKGVQVIPRLILLPIRSICFVYSCCKAAASCTGTLPVGITGLKTMYKIMRWIYKYVMHIRLLCTLNNREHAVQSGQTSLQFHRNTREFGGDSVLCLLPTIRRTH